MPSDRAARQIEKAASDGRLVRVSRRKRWDRLDGAIVDRGPTWLLMAIEYEAGSNGHALIRRSDVRHVERARNPGFIERALVAEGHWPLRGLDGLDLTSTRTALISLTQTAPLVSIYYEADNPDECLIGIPRGFRRRKFRLQTVSPAAEWDTVDAVFRYRSVSRIDVGGAYERRLAGVAGAPSSTS